MAILPAFIPGISAEVLVNGKPIPEIPDRDEIEVIHDDLNVVAWQSVRTVSTYLQTTTDTPFSIKVSVAPPYRIDCSKLGFHFMIDGKLVWTAKCERPSLAKNEGKWEFVIGGLMEGKGRRCTRKKFRFASIETQFPVVKRLAQRLQKVGTIEIRLYRENYGKKGGDTEATSKGFLNSKGEIVPEASLKGAAEKAKRDPVWRTNKSDGEDWPLAIFKFMYRTEGSRSLPSTTQHRLTLRIEDLKTLGVIDRTPTPSPPPSPPNPEREAALRQLRARVELQVRLGAGGVKREQVEEEKHWGGIARARKRRQGERVEVDLTGNDEEVTAAGGDEAANAQPGVETQTLMQSVEAEDKLFVEPNNPNN
ncbi:hypothetical protein B7494_g7759 [Chlorociboria aeruginascens]|nr:hypothetical protein B7494_g7759 [Chlorociboria aeruginascens]